MRLASFLGFALLNASGCTVTLDLDRLSEGGSGGKTGCAAEVKPGCVGAGVVIPWDRLPKREIVGGFVDAGELLLAVRVHGALDQGAVLGVDLQTGQRTIRAGWIEDANGTPHTAGFGPALRDVRSIARLSDGSWRAHLWDGFTFEGATYPIDPKTGKVGTDTRVGLLCPNLASATFWPDPADSVMNASGTVLLSVDGISLDGIATLTKSQCDATALPSEGPFVLATTADAVWYADSTTGELGKIPNGSLVAEGVAEGSAGGRVRALAIAEGAAYLYRAPSTLEVFDTKQQARRSVSVALDAGVPVNAPNLIVRPGQPPLLMESDGRILTLDPATGATTLLSY